MSTSSPGRRVDRRFIVIGIISSTALLVALLAFVFLLQKKVEDPALIIGDRVVTKKEYNRYVAQGKEDDRTESVVRETIIQYNKNKIVAKNRNIDIPKVMADQVSPSLLTNILKFTSEDFEKISDKEEARILQSDYNKMERYNFAFRDYQKLAAEGGWGIVVYDIPIVHESINDQYVAERRKLAESFRSKLVSGQITPSRAIFEISNESDGETSQVGFSMVRGQDGSILGGTGGYSFRVLDRENILNVLSKSKLGLTEVKELPGRSFYFIDVLFKADANPNIVNDIEEEKTKIRVVDYVES